MDFNLVSFKDLSTPIILSICHTLAQGHQIYQCYWLSLGGLGQVTKYFNLQYILVFGGISIRQPLTNIPVNIQDLSTISSVFFRYKILHIKYVYITLTISPVRFSDLHLSMHQNGVLRVTNNSTSCDHYDGPSASLIFSSILCNLYSCLWNKLPSNFLEQFCQSKIS